MFGIERVGSPSKFCRASKDIFKSSTFRHVLRSNECIVDENWDFVCRFDNSTITYFYYLNKSFQKQDILQFVVERYKHYIDTYLVFLIDKNVSTIYDIHERSKNFTNEQRMSCVGKFVKFNKESVMIEEDKCSQL